jgi:parallel beta-helix repeat protein
MLKLFGMALSAAVAAAVSLGAGQALADHVGCGDVITRDTTLDSDLSDCPGDGIVIGADDVTLDLDGHTIDGDGDTWGIGVASTDRLGVRVEDGTIQEFENGLRIVTRDNPGETRYGGEGRPHQTNGYLGRHVIRTLEVRSNARDGIILEGSGSDRIEDNWVHSHERTGIAIRGIWPAIASGTSIRRNHVSQNGIGIETEMYDGQVRDNVATDNGVGLSIFSVSGRVKRNLATGNLQGIGLNSHDSDIDANTATANRYDGIRFSSWNNRHELTSNRIRRNVASGNGQDGITMGTWVWGHVQAPSPQHNTFEANRASGNGRHGMYLIASGGNRLARNRATGNAASGMYLLFPRFNEISHNTVVDNGESGMVLTGRAPSNEENLIERNSVLRNGGAGISTDGFQNRIQHNATHRNLGDGIVVWNLLENLVQDNSANRNGDDGIDLAEEAPSIVARNSANRNRDLGITVIEGVVDGGGNRAWGNGNPLQCLNIPCNAG